MSLAVIPKKLIINPILLLHRYYTKLFLDYKNKRESKKIDKKYGINTQGVLRTKEDRSQFGDELRYESLGYPKILKIINYLKLNQNDVVYDLGCGTGRVVFLFAQEKIKKAVGIELRKSVYDRAKENLKKLKFKKSAIELKHGDVLDFDLSEGTVFFAWGAFGWKTTKKVLENIKNSLGKNPRKIKILIWSYDEAIILFELAPWLKKICEIGDTTIEVWAN